MLSWFLRLAISWFYCTLILSLNTYLTTKGSISTSAIRVCISGWIRLASIWSITSLLYNLKSFLLSFLLIWSDYTSIYINYGSLIS